jgi:hypothetical protein
MRHRLPAVGAALFLLPALALAQAGQDPAPRDDQLPARVAKHIAQLGSDSYSEREDARKQLEAIGTPALGALVKATKAGDLETSRRATELIRVIEEQALTAAHLAPKKLRLHLQDVPVLKAVERLAKLSGYTVRVDGDRTVLAGKTVTLDTGETTFWQALEQLATRAGLVEKLSVASVPGDPNAQTYLYPANEVVRRVHGRNVPMIARPASPPLRLVPVPEPDHELAPAKGANPAPATGAEPTLGGYLILMPGTAPPQQLSHAGSVRVSLKPARRPVTAKGQPAEKFHDLLLSASAEPRLLGFSIGGVPTITKAIDEHGQALSFVIDPPPPPGPVTQGIEVPPGQAAVVGAPKGTSGQGSPGLVLRLRPGAKPARQLKELSGALPAQVLMPNTTLAVVEKVLNATGKTVEVKGGGRLELQDITKQADKQYTVVYKLDMVPAAAPAIVRGGQVIYVNNGPIGANAMAELVDAKGQRLTRTGGPSVNQESDTDGQIIKTVITYNFRCEPGQGEPARLVLTGTHVATILVPFRFVDVALP